uniref:outer membrane protein transport protein n=1 Tax=Thaumasiovibrio occultus TaxID=1891184 RepID=UPI000B355BC0|nr:outer membrane protein transport protein [Thaumasiovibrio occultus]
MRTRLLTQSIVAALAVASTSAMAAGFQLNAQSATGIGRAFAGDAVIADNAAVMARNPAAMALFDEKAFSIGFETITTDIKVSDAEYTTPFSSANADYDEAGGTSIAPNIHLIVPVNEKFAYGVNAYSNFGTKTEFSDDYVASAFGGLTDVKSFNFGLSGSYRVNDNWSFGAGLDLIYGQGSMKRSFAGSDILNIDGADGFAAGFNLGTVYELDENNRFGFSYRYSPEFEAEDDKGQKLVLPLPDIAEFSGYHKLEDTKFAVHYSIQYIGWGSFDQIDFENLEKPIPGNSKVYAWQDGWHYSLGGTYFLNDKWTLRAGYMYDTSAQDKVTSISVPDSDRQWLSAGFTYHFDAKSNLDFGFTYLMGKEVDVNEDLMDGLLEVNAKTQANAILMGLQYSRSF